MSLNIRIECLSEPELIFGGGRRIEPRHQMAKSSPFETIAPTDIRLALVGLQPDITIARQWLSKLNESVSQRKRIRCDTVIDLVPKGFQRCVSHGRSLYQNVGRRSV